MSTITSRLEGRAAAFRQDADYASREADSCADNDRKHRALLDRAAAYRIAADELLILADEWRGNGEG
jgi:hypothetical protein